MDCRMQITMQQIRVASPSETSSNGETPLANHRFELELDWLVPPENADQSAVPDHTQVRNAAEETAQEDQEDTNLASRPEPAGVPLLLPEHSDADLPSNAAMQADPLAKTGVSERIWPPLWQQNLTKNTSFRSEQGANNPNQGDNVSGSESATSIAATPQSSFENQTKPNQTATTQQDADRTLSASIVKIRAGSQDSISVLQTSARPADPIGWQSDGAKPLSPAGDAARQPQSDVIHSPQTRPRVMPGGDLPLQVTGSQIPGQAPPGASTTDESGGLTPVRGKDSVFALDPQLLTSKPTVVAHAVPPPQGDAAKIRVPAWKDIARLPSNPPSASLTNPSSDSGNAKATLNEPFPLVDAGGRSNASNAAAPVDTSGPGAANRLHGDISHPATSLSKLSAPLAAPVPADQNLAFQGLSPDLGLEGQEQRTVQVLIHVPATASVPTTQIQQVHALPAYQQTAQQIIDAARGKVPATTEVILAPEELGRLRFEIATLDDRLTVRLFIERPDTLDLMKRQSDQLLAELRQAGFSQANLSFSGWAQGQSGAPWSQAADTPRPAHDASSDAPSAPTGVPGQLSPTGRLHIRL